MATINKIITDIINLGQEHSWFIEFLPFLNEYDYITAKGETIIIDTTCISAFKNPKRDTSDDELEEYLREMIEVNIPEAKDYQIIIEIKDEDNYL